MLSDAVCLKVIEVFPTVEHKDAIQIARAVSKALGVPVDFHDVATFLDLWRGKGVICIDYHTRWYDGYTVYKYTDDLGGEA